MELSIWQIGFSILQIVFVFALGWFIKILYAVNARINCWEVRVNKLETKDAVRKVENEHILGKIDDLGIKLDVFITDVKEMLRTKLGALL